MHQISTSFGLVFMKYIWRKEIKITLMKITLNSKGFCYHPVQNLSTLSILIKNKKRIIVVLYGCETLFLTSSVILTIFSNLNNKEGQTRVTLFLPTHNSLPLYSSNSMQLSQLHSLN
jgi:hypothetical protein